MLTDVPDIGVHYSRFRLPPDLGDTISVDVLGDAPALLGDAEPDAVAFHGTSGSWTGLDGDRALCEQLSEVTGAPSTTASLAVVEALRALEFDRVSLVFPGPQPIAELIREEYARNGIDVIAHHTPDVVYTNPEISRLRRADVHSLMVHGFVPGADAVVCIGTNLRSAYLVDELETEFGVPVIDSASTTLWQLLRMAGVDSPVAGWGSLFDD